MIWRTVAQTVKKRTPGALHCQDKSGVASSSTAALLCVSDGLGSCASSHIGARAAVSHFLGFKDAFFSCQNSCDAEAVFYEALKSFHVLLQKIADKKRKPMTDFASTLVLVLVREDLCWGVRVGDSFSVVRLNGQFISLFPPKEGAMELTKTLISRSFLCECVHHQAFADFAICSSDGLYSLTYDLTKHEPYQAFFRDLCKGLAEAQDIKKYLRYVLNAAAQHSPFDDKGVALVFQG